MTVLAKFIVNSLQILDEQGHLHSEIPADSRAPELLQNLYRLMVLNRLLDNKAIALQRTGKIGTIPTALGQEAVMAGIAYAMQADDIFVPAYRDHGVMLHRGLQIEEYLQYWGGDERGNDFKNSHDFPWCCTIASQCLHAAGIAFAAKFKKQPTVVVTTVGDGGTSKGDFYEALNFAGVQRLPFVCVIVNNQWAISVPRSAQTAAYSLAQKAIAAGFAGIQVDGNDAIAVHHAVQQAVTKAREGRGPTLIEAICFRLSDHTTADDAKRYCAPEEIESAWQKEPIKRLRNYLVQQQLWSEQQEQQLHAECKKKIEMAIENYFTIPKQPATAMFDYLYATLPDAYLAQYQELGERHG